MNDGASRTIAFVLPVSASIPAGIGTPRLTSVLHSETGTAMLSPGELDPDDADLCDGVDRRRGSRGLEVDEREDRGEQAHDASQRGTLPAPRASRRREG